MFVLSPTGWVLNDVILVSNSQLKTDTKDFLIYYLFSLVTFHETVTSVLRDVFIGHIGVLSTNHYLIRKLDHLLAFFSHFELHSLRRPAEVRLCELCPEIRGQV